MTLFPSYVTLTFGKIGCSYTDEIDYLFTCYLERKISQLYDPHIPSLSFLTPSIKFWLNLLSWNILVGLIHPLKRFVFFVSLYISCVLNLVLWVDREYDGMCKSTLRTFHDYFPRLGHLIKKISYGYKKCMKIIVKNF